MVLFHVTNHPYRPGDALVSGGIVAPCSRDENGEPTPGCDCGCDGRRMVWATSDLVEGLYAANHRACTCGKPGSATDPAFSKWSWARLRLIPMHIPPTQSWPSAAVSSLRPTSHRCERSSDIPRRAAPRRQRLLTRLHVEFGRETSAPRWAASGSCVAVAFVGAGGPFR